ncbi:MAG TPA: glycosyltransferase [Bacteroidales bacterium]|nr:glycosyltransferase [Bacteroidales bacterium]
MNLIAILTIILGLLYAFLIFAFSRGWRKLKPFGSENNQEIKPGFFVSIVIAARNEEKNIGSCLNDLLDQDFPSGNFEIIVVDDHSEDATALLVHKNIQSNAHLKLISLADLTNEAYGKKAAIAAGVALARGELIITTDADCRFTNQWLKTMVAYYQRFRPAMIIGPVSFFPQRSFWGKFMELEFISLVAAGAGALALKRPMMCNGANLAFTREAFSAVNIYKENIKWASGDDMFLMHGIRKKYGASAIHFLMAAPAIVRTWPPKSLKGFLAQRKRWGSKTRAYPQTFTAAVAVVVFLNSLILLSTSVLSVFSPALMFAVFAGWVLKTLSDFMLIFPASAFFNRRYLMPWFIPFQAVHVLYIVVAALSGLFSGFQWKGRRL